MQNTFLGELITIINSHINNNSKKEYLIEDLELLDKKTKPDFKYSILLNFKEYKIVFFKLTDLINEINFIYNKISENKNMYVRSINKNNTIHIELLFRKENIQKVIVFDSNKINFKYETTNIIIESFKKYLFLSRNKQLFVESLIDFDDKKPKNYTVIIKNEHEYSKKHKIQYLYFSSITELIQYTEDIFELTENQTIEDIEVDENEETFMLTFNFVQNK